MSAAVLSLLAHAFAPHYLEPVLPLPREVDERALWKAAAHNKVEWGVAEAVQAGRLPVAPSTRSARLLREMERRGQAQDDALRLVAARLRGMRYCAYKTVRGFPYVSHDVDVLVDDLDAAGSRFRPEDGEPYPFPQRAVHLTTPGGIEVEVYDRIVPGNVWAVDLEDVWERLRTVQVAGGDLTVPGAEVEVLALLAEGALRLFEVKWGDMLWLFRLAGEADWAWVLAQAERHGWGAACLHALGALQALHVAAYGDAHASIPAAPSPRSSLAVPYVPPFLLAMRTVAAQDPRQLAKAAGYVSVVLKRYPPLHRAYIAAYGPAAKLALRTAFRVRPPSELPGARRR